MKRWALRGGICVVLAVGLLGVPACERASDPARVESLTQAFEAQVDSPRAVAASLLECLRLEIDAARDGNRELAEAYRARLVDVAAAGEIRDRYEQLIRGRLKLTKGQAVAEVTETWAPLVAYYREELDPAALNVAPHPEDATTAIVTLPLTRGDETERLRIECVRSSADAGEWGVVHLEIMPARTPMVNLAVPTTQPAVPGTQPADGG